MDQHDPELLLQPPRLKCKSAPGWLSGSIHRYFYTSSDTPAAMTAEAVNGFEITRVWDENREIAQAFADLFGGRPEVCDRFEQVSDEVDLVFIADCDLDGSDHVELARPGLEKGVATFVDKPFGGTLANAKRMLDLANDHDAPIYSQSICVAMPETARFRERFAEIGPLTCGTVQSPGREIAGQIHATCLTHFLFGDNVREVRAMNLRRQLVMHLDYGDVPDRPSAGVVYYGYGGPDSGFYLQAYGAEGKADAVINNWTYPNGATEILKTIREMVHTRRTPIRDIQDMMDAIRLMTAVRLAVKTEKPVQVSDVKE
jgi:hypothetical protein